MTEDWRLRRQERYLQGATFSRKKYAKRSERWDHDHCEFCWATFSEREGDLHEGYVTADDYRWVCDECFADFKERFAWKLGEEP